MLPEKLLFDPRKLTPQILEQEVDVLNPFSPDSTCLASTCIHMPPPSPPSRVRTARHRGELQELQEMIDEADRDGDGGEAQRNDGDGGEARGFQERLSHVT